jgi:hypothetical protein
MITFPRMLQGKCLITHGDNLHLYVYFNTWQLQKTEILTEFRLLDGSCSYVENLVLLGLEIERSSTSN